MLRWDVDGTRAKAALVGPGGIPPEVVAALAAAAGTVVAEPAVRSRLLAAGFGPVPDGSPAAARAHVAAELARFRAVVAAVDLRTE